MFTPQLAVGTNDGLLQQAWNDVMGNDSYLSLTESEISDHKEKDNEVSSLSDNELSFLWSRLNIQEQEEVSAVDDLFCHRRTSRCYTTAKE